MMKPIRFHPAAVQDLEDAYRWYEHQRQGLGEDFLLCVEAAINAASENPQRYPVIHSSVRRILLRRFPYGLFFVVDDEMVAVLAVFHCHRHPRHWQSRR